MADHLQNESFTACACRIRIAWSDPPPGEDVVHTLDGVYSRCADHGYISDDSLLGVLREEDFRQSRARVIAADISGLPDEEIVISWDGGRTCTISFLGNVSGAKKSQIQAACDDGIGLGLVVVV